MSFQWRTKSDLRTRRTKRRRAFTLLELIVVLALIGILAGVIVPRMGSSISRRELDAAASRFAQTARTVRALAVSKGELCALAINLDEGHYSVAVADAQGTRSGWRPLQMSWLKAQRWPRSVTVASYRTPEGRRLATGTQYLKFNPDGTSSGVALQLAADGATRAIVVQPYSGRVTWSTDPSADFGIDQIDLGD